jgi:hypothetical protein
VTVTASASIRIEGQITSLPTGSVKVGPIDLTSAAANGQVQWVVLQAGANTITLPASPAPSGCVITLPSTNTSIVTLKGITGDTGIALGKTTTQVLNWDSTAAPTSFCLTSVSTQTGLATQITFF